MAFLYFLAASILTVTIRDGGLGGLRIGVVWLIIDGMRPMLIGSWGLARLLVVHARKNSKHKKHIEALAIDAANT